MEEQMKQCQQEILETLKKYNFKLEVHPSFNIRITPVDMQSEEIKETTPEVVPEEAPSEPVSEQPTTEAAPESVTE